jgi:hypothetical protein
MSNSTLSTILEYVTESSNWPIIGGVGGAAVLIVGIALFFTIRWFMKRLRAWQYLVIPYGDVQHIESNNWIWPRLLLEQQKSEEDFLSALDDDTDDDAKPRSEPSIAQYAIIKHGTEEIKVLYVSYLIRPDMLSFHYRGQKIDALNEEEIMVKQSPNRRLRVTQRKAQRKLINLKLLNHQNVAELICVSFWDSVAHFFYEPAERGTLEDALMNRRFSLSVEIRLSMIRDLIHGFHYLKKSRLVKHLGNLNCRTVMIDQNWILKIAGIGLTEFIRLDDSEQNKHLKAYIAPELLSQYPYLGKTSFTSDIYR